MADERPFIPDPISALFSREELEYLIRQLNRIATAFDTLQDDKVGGPWNVDDATGALYPEEYKGQTPGIGLLSYPVNYILFGKSGQAEGVAGYSDSSEPGTFIGNAPAGSYDPNQGALLCGDGFSKLKGTTTLVEALKESSPDPDVPFKLVAVNVASGQLFSVEPPPVGWSVSTEDTTDTDLGSGDLQGPWVKMTNLEVTLPDNVAIGQRIDATIVLNCNVSSGTGELHVGLGVSGAEPTAYKGELMVNGFDGLITVATSVTANSALSTGTPITVWTRRGAVIGTQVTGSWDVKHKTGDPSRKECNAYASGQHRVSHYDSPNENNRQTDLESVEPGWTMEYGLYSSIINSVSHQSDHVRFFCDAGRDEEDEYLFTFSPAFALTLPGSVRKHEFFLSTP